MDMSIFKKVVVHVLAAVLLVSAAPVLVSAHEGHDHNDDSVSSSDDSNSRRGRDANKIEDSATHKSSSHSREVMVKMRGAELLAAAKLNHSAKSKEDRQRACKVRKQGIENRSTKIFIAADRHQAKIDGAFAKVAA